MPLHLHGLLALLPFADLVAHVTVFSYVLWLSELSLGPSLYWAGALGGVLILGWRFLVLLTALTPPAGFFGFLLMYMPLFLHPCWSCIVGREASGETIQAMYDQQASSSSSKPRGASPARARGAPGGPGSSLEMYGRETNRVRSFMLRQHEAYMRQGHFLFAFVFIVFFEIRLLLLTVIFGPALLWRSAVATLLEFVFACGVSGDETAVQKDSLEHIAYQRLLAIAEAFCQGALQIGLQSFIYFRSEVELPMRLYYTSAGISGACILVSLVNLLAQRETVGRALRPGRQALVRRVLTLVEKPAVDSAILAAEIVAACAAGATLDEVSSGVSKLKEVHVAQARELRDAGYSVHDLRADGFLGVELKQAGFLPAELKAAGYTAADMASDKEAAVKRAKVTTPDSVGPTSAQNDSFNSKGPAVGFCSSRSGTTTATGTGMFSTRDPFGGFGTGRDFGFFSTRDGGFFSTRDDPGGEGGGGFFSTRGDALESPNLTPRDEDASGKGGAAGLFAIGKTPAQLVAAGYTLEQLHEGQVPAKALKDDGYSANELVLAGYTLTDLKAADFPLQQLKQMGYTAEELHSVGYTGAHLRAIGFHVTDLLALGLSLKQLKQAGFNLKVLKNYFTFEDMVEAGYSASDFKSAGVSPDNKAMGKALASRQGGYSLAEMKQAGYTVKQLKAVGYTALQLREADFLLSQLAPHFSPMELRLAGFMIEELSSAGFNAKKLHDAGFTALAMKKEGYQAGELKNAGFTAAELKEAGYTISDLKSAGFADKQLEA